MVVLLVALKAAQWELPKVAEKDAMTVDRWVGSTASQWAAVLAGQMVACSVAHLANLTVAHWVAHLVH